MTNIFVDVLGNDLDNIKEVDNFLNTEEHIYLLGLAKKSELVFNENSLHFEAHLLVRDEKIEKIMNKVNKKIIKYATKVYNKKFLNNCNYGLNVHRVNSFTDPHVDIIDGPIGHNIPGQIEPTYNNWRDAWDGYLACNLYLNDDYIGGEVYFPERNYEFKPKANSLVMWPGNKHFIHGIRKTTNNSRYVYGVFIKFADYDKYSQ